jgi:hypothetical protein
VPPPQCPECGRFLKQSYVDQLSADPTSCPRCGTGLVASMFPEDRSVRPPDLGPADATAVPAAPAADRSVRPPDLGPADATAVPAAPAADGSVRPPDLVPVTVRDEARDVLAGWDVGADRAEVGSWRADRPPFPTDAAIVAGAGVAGALVGALVPPRRGRNAALGGAAGVLAAAVGRQVWRLEP